MSEPHPNPTLAAPAAAETNGAAAVARPEAGAGLPSLPLLAAALEQAQDAVAIASSALAPPGPLVLHVNAAFAALTGWTTEELRGRPASGLCAPATDRLTIDRVRALLAEGRSATAQGALLRSDGSACDVEVRVTPVRDAQGRVTALAAVVRDVAERRRREHALRDASALLGAAFDATALGLGLIDPYGRFARVNPALCALLGRDTEDLLACRLADLVHADDRAADLENESRVRRGEIRLGRLEVRWTTPGGRSVRVLRALSRLAAPGDGPPLLLLEAEEVPERRSPTDGRSSGAWREDQERLLRELLHDRRTGLPTTALWLDRVRGAMARSARRPQSSCGVLAIGVDPRALPPAAAPEDDVEAAIGRAIRDALRPGDTVAHLEGGRFGVLLEGLAETGEAAIVAERLHRRVVRAMGASEAAAASAVSIGVAFPAPEHERPEELLAAAELARTGGRGESAGATERADAEAAAMRLREADVRHALEREELLLHYQPILSLADARVVGFEAFLRWLRPDGALREASEVLPAVYRAGLVAKVGDWALHEACRRARLWQTRFPSDPPVFVAVNVSARELTQPDFAGRIEAALRESAVDPRALAIEVSERTVLSEPQALGAAAPRLRLRGVRVHVDRVAGGGASLGWLSRFRVDRLKLDAALLVDGPAGLTTARALATLAGRFGTEVVAERVETAAQLAAARALRCRYAQGFLLSPPRDGAAADAVLEGAARRGSGS